jgi:ribonuclease G
VLTPWAGRVGVSRRIDSEKERRRLRETVTRLRARELGFIIRTAGEGTREADLEADVKYLTSVWDDIQILKDQRRAPAVLYKELSLPLRAIRDFSNGKTRRLVVDDPATHEQMSDFLSRFVADPKPRLEFYEEPLPVFDRFGIESSIDENMGRKVWLKSGGYLIIDQSEALTAIDVNTGRYVGKRDLEETVLKTNLEAVQEVVFQLRFRNIGGLIIIDLIDMESAENRDKVYRALQEALREDKSKTNILKISELGLVEMTRKRTRENLVQQLCEPCAHCEGRGYLLSAESVAYKVLREVQKDLPRFCGRHLALTVSTRVAQMLLGPARKATQALGTSLGREIEIRARPGLHQEQFEVVALDEGPPVAIELSWLSDRSKAESEHVPEPADLVPAKLSGAEAIEAEPQAGEPPTGEEGSGSQPEIAETAAAAVAAAPEPEPAAAAEAAAPEPEPAAAAEAAVPEPEPAAAAEAEPPEPERSPAAAASEAAEEPEPAAPAPVGVAAAEPAPGTGYVAVDGDAESPILPRFQKSEES